MYIKEIKLTNIKSVRQLHMTFEKPAGWHVLLGDNGVGKSSILRAICSGLVGPFEILRLNPSFGNWVTVGEESAEISMRIERSHILDKYAGTAQEHDKIDKFWCKTKVAQDKENGRTWKFLANNEPGIVDPNFLNWTENRKNGWFSAAFGPYRRFVGGDDNLRYMFKQNPKIGAHLTVFSEGVALTEVVTWLKDTLLNSLSKDSENDRKTLACIRTLLNKGALLPEGFLLMDINSDGLFFSTPSGDCIHLYELSEGLKSVTCLTLELIRLLVETYGPENVFRDFSETKTIKSQGVVLIDEIDVHLHPSWQARIGQWFTSVFPNIQFIVTTHSPIICRAGVHGSIWHLEQKEYDVVLRQIQGQEFNDLIYGDILDAFESAAFGSNITRSSEGQEGLDRLAELNVKKERTKDEDKERSILIKRFKFNGAN